MAYRVVVRAGPRVERFSAPSLAAALGLLESQCRALAVGGRPGVRFFGRTIEPVQQVVARGEVSGPGRLRPAVRGGVDVRGDGSAEAWTGHVRRRLVEQRPGETPYDALRRTMASESTGP